MINLELIKNKYVDVVEDILNKNVSNACVIYINPSTYLYFRKYPSFINEVTGIRFDGILMRWFIDKFIVKDRLIARQSFDMTSLAPHIFSHCVQNNKTVFISGGKSQELSKFIDIIKGLYPDLNIAGTCNGYESEEVIISSALKSEADVVILGLGNIKQERVACKLYQRKPALYFTCGAFISQTASTQQGFYYPDWVDNYNMRWLYRSYKEKHILWRILRYYPQFIPTFVLDVKKYRNKREGAFWNLR